jgi:hypothetical protein
MDNRALQLLQMLGRGSDVEAIWQMDPAIRDWRQNLLREYGELPSLDSPGYNYRAAIAAGVLPEPYAPDQGRAHWPQDVDVPPFREPAPLKPEDHPTAWMGPVYAVTGTDPSEMTLEQWREAERQGALEQFIRALARNAGPRSPR